MKNDQQSTCTEPLTAVAIRMVDLANYQEGSIVSRTLIKKKTGTITFFAFDQQQELSEHTAPYDALAHIIEGETEIVISGKIHHLKVGEMIIMPANEPHTLRALKKFKLLLTMIRS
ncbi:MAG: cupin domain-containing protein [Candidatus Brocadiales bacterium]|nr:cupin domain-containing protein [Candidatus Bathyanammoxibius sp.]